MKSFLNLPVRAKLFAVFGVIIVLFAIALGVAYSSITDLLETQGVARDKQTNVSDFARVESGHNEGRVSTLMILASTDKAAQAQWIEQVRAASRENTAALERLQARNAAAPEFLQNLQKFQQIRDAYTTTRERVLELVLAGNLDEARRISLGENRQHYLTVRTLVDEMMRRSDADATAAFDYAKTSADRARNVFLLLGGGVLVASLLGVVVIGRQIANPLQELLFVARRMSEGDLKVTVPLTGQTDEIGVLAQALATMQEKFHAVHREIQEGVDVLTTSANEIFTATAQIAASVTETSTAVTQTTSTVEEVKQTARLSAQKAGQVASVAQKAAQDAQTSRKAIEESVIAMQNMREQVELIGETVVRLSEQSQAIGDITASVNDLAEQSNLLAVNASIEAAKAGEHGKGFAVVAQEIRNLAIQSKESTGQIRKILHEIQRATSATVMAAEQGSKAVEIGVKHISQSGEAIRSLAEIIVTAAQAATQITASSQEQLIGIEQVTMAIQNILQASRQNAVGMQQVETGTKNLSQLGRTLKLTAQRFTV